MDYRGCRATIMGLGHFGGGVAAARWLARQGAIVTVTDQADEQSLADALPLLAGLSLAAVHVGGHRPDDFQGADLIVVNPAVQPTSPWLDLARRSGARLSTELELFMENCPARIIGVTGSNGKSTTAAMIASILRTRAEAGGAVPCRTDFLIRPRELDGLGNPSYGSELDGLGNPSYESKRRVFLGGNIGVSLLDELPQIGRDDWVVLEISSFQLWHFTPAARMPHIAVITGCTSNHLDWHASFADYAAAKQRILTGQTPGDFAVLNTCDAEVATWSRLVRGKQRSPHTPCADLECGYGVASLGGAAAQERSAHGVCGVQYAQGSAHGVCGLHYPHNRINAACAAAAAMAAGCGPEDIRRGLEQFRPLPQRLEWFADVDDRRFYNDSAATTPESTIAVLRSLALPAWLLAGGKSKGFDFGPLAAEIAQRARGAAFFGAAGPELRRRVAARRPQMPSIALETMEEALDWCWSRSTPGEAIVLSPACASTDQFRNFQQRGERFVELVRHLAEVLAGR